MSVRLAIMPKPQWLLKRAWWSAGTLGPTRSSSASTPTIPHQNPALELAIQRHIDKLPEAEKDTFRTAAKEINEHDLLAKIREYDNHHAHNSSFRPRTEQLSKLLRAVDRFMGGVAIGIQANPDLSAIIVGGIRIVIDLAIDFVEFFDKLTDMLCQFEDYLPTLATLADVCQDSSLILESLTGAYADLLDFCQKAHAVFVGSDGKRRSWISWRVFLRHQWEPFNMEFGSIRMKMRHRVEVLRLAGQAQQLSDNLRKEKEDFLNWISPHNYEEAHDNIYAKKHPGTGEWLLQTDEFQTWVNSRKSDLLWCYGKPGAGKSVLASNVLEHLTAKHGLDDKTAICFAYYNYRTPELQSPKQIAAALLKQLCRQSATVSPKFLSFKQAARRPSLAHLEQFLIKLPADMKIENVYIVIDGLDECPERDRPRIIQLLIEVTKGLPCAKVFITSRKESDIERAFAESGTQTIQIQAKNVEADIRSFVVSEVRKLRQGYHGKKLFLSSDVLEERVIQTLTENAEGMFLWVKLQLDNLCIISKARRDHLIEQALYKLPQGLDETYIRIVQRINEQPKYMRDLAMTALMWILHAKRPLYTKELQHALATDRAYDTNADIDVDQEQVILEACGHLILVESEVVRPTHYSVQEFFMSPSCGITRECLQQSVLEPSIVHQTLASVCIKHILLVKLTEPCKNDMQLYHHVQNTPFACYATHYFDRHVQAAKDLSPQLLQLLETLLKQDSASLAAMLQLRMANDDYYHSPELESFRQIKFQVSASTILYATHLFEVNEIRARWLGTTIPRYALHQASKTGSENAVRHLLDQKAEINEVDEEGNHALYYAAIEGHLAIVTLLLEHNADSNAQGGGNGNALQAACYGGCGEMVKVLLTKGANVNMKGGQYGTALQAACFKGHQKVVNILLAKNADVNAQGGLYGTALQAACYNGNEKVVDILLRKGANINAEGGHYGSALQAACYGGHEKVVDTLLAKGADVNAQGGKYGNAIQAAQANGKQGVIDMLLLKGSCC